MTFAHDIHSNLQMLVDLLNTSGTTAEADDELRTPAQLTEFAARHDFSGPLKATTSDVEATRRLRRRFATAITGDMLATTSTETKITAEAGALDETEASDETEISPEAVVEHVVEAANLTLQETRALPQLVRHDDWGWHLHAVGAQASLADRVAADVALVLIDLIRGGDLDRIGRCAAEDCTAFLADFTRNRSKRFCDTGNCANRTHVAAFRARQAE